MGRSLVKKVTIQPSNTILMPLTRTVTSTNTNQQTTLEPRVTYLSPQNTGVTHTRCLVAIPAGAADNKFSATLSPASAWFMANPFDYDETMEMNEISRLSNVVFDADVYG